MGLLAFLLLLVTPRRHTPRGSLFKQDDPITVVNTGALNLNSPVKLPGPWHHRSITREGRQASHWAHKTIRRCSRAWPVWPEG